MTGTVQALPSTGAGSAVAGAAGIIGVAQGSLLLLAFTCLVIGLHILNMARLEVNAHRLRRDGRLD